MPRRFQCVWPDDVHQSFNAGPGRSALFDAAINSAQPRLSKHEASARPTVLLAVNSGTTGPKAFFDADAHAHAGPPRDTMSGDAAATSRRASQGKGIDTTSMKALYTPWFTRSRPRPPAWDRFLDTADSAVLLPRSEAQDSSSASELRRPAKLFQEMRPLGTESEEARPLPKHAVPSGDVEIGGLQKLPGWRDAAVAPVRDLGQFSGLAGGFWFGGMPIFSQPVSQPLLKLLYAELGALVAVSAIAAPRLYRAVMDPSPEPPLIPWTVEFSKYFGVALPYGILYTALNVTVPAVILSSIAPVQLDTMLQSQGAALTFFSYLFSVVVADVWNVGYVAIKTSQSRSLRPRASRAKPLPDSEGPLHVIVVPNFKEPLDMFRQLLNSLATQTVPLDRIVVVLAMEARDEEQDATFQTLQSEYAQHFTRGFWRSVHVLRPWEAPGTGSNAAVGIRYAYQRLVGRHRRMRGSLREVLQQRPPGWERVRTFCPEEHNELSSGEVLDPDLLLEDIPVTEDPWNVLVTKCDVDHIFPPEYLEQIETSFRRQIDGRRYIYAGRVLETNLETCDTLVQTHAMGRAYKHFFYFDTTPSLPVSTLSLTLGLCEEHGFWGPVDQLGEDVLQSMKASFVSGAQAVQRTWVPVITQAPCTVLSRYQQCKRWEKGNLQHVAWAFSIFIDGRLDLSAGQFLLQRTSKFKGCPTELVVTALLPQILGLFASIAPASRHALLLAAASLYTIEVCRIAVRDVVLAAAVDGATPIIAPAFAAPTTNILKQPFLRPVGKLLFEGLATWHAAAEMAIDMDLGIRGKFFSAPRITCQT